jgi:hypothetical protein
MPVIYQANWKGGRSDRDPGAMGITVLCAVAQGAMIRVVLGSIAQPCGNVPSNAGKFPLEPVLPDRAENAKNSAKVSHLT